METIMNFMAKDHDRLDSLFSQFRNHINKNADEARSCFHEFKIGLQRHIVWEEEILFPFFEEKTGMPGGPTEVMRTEHRQIKDFLEKIHYEIINGTNKEIAELETGLFKVLTDHNQKEEEILYPWIDNSAGEIEIKKLFIEMENTPAEKYNECCK